MKKLLLSGITAVALMAAGTAQAGGLSLMGETGLARTPLAMSLAPMTGQVAIDYVNSDNLFLPIRGGFGLGYGVEIGGAYWYTDTEFDLSIWNVGAKWVLPNFVENLNLAVGGHYNKESGDGFSNDGHDLYFVASYVAPMGDGMSLIPTFGMQWDSITGDNDENAFRFFGSLLFKTPMYAIGGEYLAAVDKLDGEGADGSYWFGGRFFLNPAITLQAGYTNNANVNDEGNDFEDGKFHIGAQFAFGGN